MTTVLRPRKTIRRPEYHPDDLTYPDETPSEVTEYLFLGFYPGIMKIYEGQTTRQAYEQWHDGTVKHAEYMRTECPRSTGMVPLMEYSITDPAYEQALLDSTPLPCDMVRIILSYVRARDIFEDVLLDLMDYWDDKFLESESDSEEEDSFEYSDG